MAEFLLFVLIFVVIMVISALVFGGWVLVMVGRGIASLLGIEHPRRTGGPYPQSPSEPRPIGARRPSGAVQIGPVPAPTAPPPDAKLCQYELCRAANEPGAHFCRRCGRRLPAPSNSRRAQVRRVALW